MQAHDEVSRQSLPFPTAVQSRTYDATITQSGARLEIQFTPAECQGGYYGKPGVCAPLPDSFDCHRRVFTAGGCAAGAVTGTQIRFDVQPAPATRLCGGGDYWWEGFAERETFEACGVWAADAKDPAVISGRVNGTFVYVKLPEQWTPEHRWDIYLSCPASDHEFTLVKR